MNEQDKTAFLWVAQECKELPFSLKKQIFQQIRRNFCQNHGIYITQKACEQCEKEKIVVLFEDYNFWFLKSGNLSILYS
jgi:hypothetical protein